MELKDKSQRVGFTEDNLSYRQYNFILAGTLFWGFFMNFLFATIFQSTFIEMSPFVLTLGYFISAIIGVFVARSESPILSFIGYNLVAVPSGAVLAVSLADYGAHTITKALLIVSIITLIMFVASIMLPEHLLGIGSFLSIGLLSALILEVISILLGFDSTIFDWIFVLIFSGYLGYDFAVAQTYDKTINNAVDSALDLYLDIINLLLRILSLMGKDD